MKLNSTKLYVIQTVYKIFFWSVVAWHLWSRGGGWGGVGGEGRIKGKPFFHLFFKGR